MPAMANYELRVEGIISGSMPANGKAIALFQGVFPKRAPSGKGELGGADGWPDGFVLKPIAFNGDTEAYKTCFWESDGYKCGDNMTLLSFRSEVQVFAGGALYDAPIQARLLQDVEWFYKYRDQAWYQSLYLRIHDLNQALAGLATVIEKVRFREWKWYCGNGGGD